MSETDGAIHTVGEFLAHALEVEEQSVEQYITLADSMEVHHNTEVAELFHRLAHFSELHAAEVRQRAASVAMPRIAPWEFKWNCPGSPEADYGDTEVNYLMTPRQALELALHNEVQGRDFYAAVAASSSDAEVRALAAEMADEEEEHVALLETWLARDDVAEHEPQMDLDPPNMPE